MSLSLFQAEMLNDPEFVKNVKGLERMLRVRESACLGLAGSDSSGSRVVCRLRESCCQHSVRVATWCCVVSLCFWL